MRNRSNQEGIVVTNFVRTNWTARVGILALVLFGVACESPQFGANTADVTGGSSGSTGSADTSGTVGGLPSVPPPDPSIFAADIAVTHGDATTQSGFRPWEDPELADHLSRVRGDAENASDAFPGADSIQTRPSIQAGYNELLTVGRVEQGWEDSAWGNNFGWAINDLSQQDEYLIDTVYNTSSGMAGLGSVGGGYATGSTDIKAIVARHDAAGILDSEFDGNGLLGIDIAGTDNTAVAVKQWNNKMFIVMRSQTNGEQQFGFARVSWETGENDNSCDDNGVFGTTFGGYDGAIPFDIAIEPSAARFVISGCVYDGAVACDHPAIAVYSVSECELLYQEVLSNYTGHLHAVTYDTSISSPKIYATGSDCSDPDDTHILVASFDRDGEPVDAFGMDGVVTTDIATSTHEYGRGIVYNASRVYVGGTGHYGGEARMQFARYMTSTGILDENCSADGIYNTTTFIGTGTNNFATLLNGTRLYLVGANQNSGSDIAIVAYQTDCTIDGDFGDVGKQIVDVRTWDYPRAAALVGDHLRIAGFGQ